MLRPAVDMPPAVTPPALVVVRATPSKAAAARRSGEPSSGMSAQRPATEPGPRPSTDSMIAASVAGVVRTGPETAPRTVEKGRSASDSSPISPGFAADRA